MQENSWLCLTEEDEFAEQSWPAAAPEAVVQAAPAASSQHQLPAEPAAAVELGWD